MSLTEIINCECCMDNQPCRHGTVVSEGYVCILCYRGIEFRGEENEHVSDDEVS